MEGARTEKMHMEDYTELPPGFRFHPTDPELIGYLEEKVRNPNFTTMAIGEVNLNKYEPWALKSQAKLGEKVFYFYCQKDRKYPTGSKTNRATELGFWKATGKDRKVCRGKNAIVGMKKTLVFHKGRAPRGEKTGWIMHEYRLTSRPPCNLPKSTKSEWVVCRIFCKKGGEEQDMEEESSACPPSQANEYHHTMDRLPPLIDSPERTAITGGCSYVNHRFQFQFPAAPSSIAYAKSTVSFAGPSSSKGMGCSKHGGLIATTSMAVQCKTEQDQVSATTSVALQCKDEKKFEPQVEASTSYDIASIFQNGPTDEDPHLFVEEELMDLSSMWNV